MIARERRNTGDPTIRDAKQMAKRYGKDGIIIVHVIDGRIGYASYGRGAGECVRMRNLADEGFKRLGVTNADS